MQKCFSANNMCTKLMNTLRSSISQVAELELLQNRCTVEDSVIALESPAPKQVAVCSETSSASPAVLVIIKINSDCRNFLLKIYLPKIFLFTKIIMYIGSCELPKESMYLQSDSK